MDDATIRQRLANAQGEQYWRGLEELADSEAFQKYVRQRIETPIPPTSDPISRRRFLALLGATLGLAGISGCALEPPQQTIVPYVRAPTEIVPGEPLFYATTMTVNGYGTGLLVESREGRPIKIEGNQDHPASLGGTDVFAQADILSLYDPERSQTIRFYGDDPAQRGARAGRVRSWGDTVNALRLAMGRQQEKRGAGVYLLTESISSPTLLREIEQLRKQYPELSWHVWEPVGDDMAREGSRLAFGDPVNTYYRFDRATTVLSLGADFFVAEPGHVRSARDFMARRREGINAPGAEPPEMNRLYVAECMPTPTGAKADHRWRMRPSQIGDFARAVAARLGVGQGEAESVESVVPDAWVRALAEDLQKHRGASIVIPGREMPAEVHLLAHAMNDALGNVGKTVIHTDPVVVQPSPALRSLEELAEAMKAGRVEVLAILGGNPVYTAPADLDFGSLLRKVPVAIHLSAYENETSQLCQWHINEAHWLEAWSDARAFDGTASIVQPLIRPLYNGRTAHEVLVALQGRAERSGYEEVRATWREFWESRNQNGDGKKPSQGDSFEDYWWQALNTGVLAGTEFEPKQVSLKGGWAQNLPTGSRSSEGMELFFQPDPSLYDGRYANNAWLQELPKPLTKLTWGNAAMLSPATAERLGVGTRPVPHGGERGKSMADTVLLRFAGREVEAPIWIVPGHADEAVTLHLGFGRPRAGSIGSGVGVNAYVLRTAEAMWSGGGLEAVKTGNEIAIACTQYVQLTEGRHLVRSGTIEEYREDPASIAEVHGHDTGRDRPLAHLPESTPEKTPGDPELPGLLPEHPYDGYKWAMGIDMTACVGCNACVVACQAENNIPVIGQEQVFAGRIMHWLRIDTYHKGPAESPETYFQPLPCMHCEKAPCELVCPVAATVHSDDGLNDMVYNRCVGTRYCSNNCPYKVRRFNFLQYADWDAEPLKLLYNPEVTVRSRGVMEKCTYCVQRIRQAGIHAEKEGRRVRDGEMLTACQAVCPAVAITFGDMNDPGSEVTRWKASPLDYGLLAELNTQPRTTYLAAVRNPNPAIEAV